MMLQDTLFIDNQIKNGACLYAPILVHKDNYKPETFELSKKNQLYKKILRNEITKKIIATLNLNVNSNSEHIVNLQNETFTTDPNFWISTLKNSWQGKLTMNFQMMDNTYVTASTMVSPHQKSKPENILKDFYTENPSTYYLCIECLLYGKGSNDFLFHISGKAQHREITHGHLIFNTNEPGLAERLATDYKIKNIEYCGHLNYRHVFPCSSQLLLNVDPGRSRECLLSITLSHLDQIEIFHVFNSKKDLLSVKTESIYRLSSVTNSNTLKLQGEDSPIEGKYAFDVKVFNESYQILLWNILRVTQIIIDIPGIYYSVSLGVTNPLFFQHLLIKKLQTFEQMTAFNNVTEFRLIIGSEIRVISTALSARYVQMIVDFMVKHVDLSTGEFPRRHTNFDILEELIGCNLN